MSYVNGPREPKQDPWVQPAACCCEGAQDMWVCPEHGEQASPEKAEIVRRVAASQGVTRELAWRLVRKRRWSALFLSQLAPAPEGDIVAQENP